MVKEPRKKKKQKKRLTSSVIQPTETPLVMEILNPNAGAVDIGSTEHFVCLGLNRATDVRIFGCTTADLLSLADWLEERGVTTFAMESTGHYWYALYDVLVRRGKIAVTLVNGRFSKNISGRKSDLLDCEWLYKLHSFGLLRGSFLTDAATEELKIFNRHRQNLIRTSVQNTLRINKSLRRMNIVLDSVLSNLQTVSARKMIEAIIRGERDAEVLADMAGSQVKASREKRIAALTGNWRDSDVLEIAQNYESYCLIQNQLTKLDLKIDKHLGKMVVDTEGVYQPNVLVAKAVEDAPKEGQKVPSDKTTKGKTPAKTPVETDKTDDVYPTSLNLADPFKQKTTGPPKGSVVLDFTKVRRQQHQHEIPFDIQGYAFKTWGVDLFAIPGIGRECVMALMSEIGSPANWLKFPTAGHFAAWLGLLPNNRISGGKVLSSHRIKHSNRVAVALRQGAANVIKANVKKDTPLHRFGQRLLHKKGKSSAIVAIAGKVARIIWHMITEQKPFQQQSIEDYEAHVREQTLKKIQRQVLKLNISAEELSIIV